MKRVILILFLIQISFQSLSQFTRDQAISLIVNEVVGVNNLQSFYTYGRYLDMIIGDTLWLEDDIDFLIGPYDKNWVFFIDMEPLAFWVHPCQIIFVSKENGEFEKSIKEWPPTPFISDQPLFLENWEWILSIGSLETKKKPMDISIYPNPASRHLTIKMDRMLTADFGVRLYTVFGELIREIKKLSHRQNTFSIDVQSLPNGVYFLALRLDAENPIFKKIVIEH